MVAFKGGNNTGGQNVDYYDNPNYDPKKDGKSSTDYIKKQSNATADWKETADYKYYELGEGDYDDVVQAEGEAAYNKAKADKQTSETVSYFRARERERLNPGISRSPQINPKFSQPASLDDKLGKFGMSFDPQDPDTYNDQAAKIPEGQLTKNSYDTSRGIGNYTMIEETSKYAKGTPMPNTVAGVNQELQARKTRTRDFAMEFKGTIYDYIEDIRLKTLDSADSEVAEFYNQSDDDFQMNKRQPLSYVEIENKYFPDTASKKAAKTELQKMISFTDEASDIAREYSNLSDYAETVIRKTMSSLPIPIGIDDGGASVNDKLTKANYEKGIKEFQAWKSKKGIPKIIRLISKLG